MIYLTLNAARRGRRGCGSGLPDIPFGPTKDAARFGSLKSFAETVMADAGVAYARALPHHRGTGRAAFDVLPAL